jgi:hypothetical protein
MLLAGVLLATITASSVSFSPTVPARPAHRPEGISAGAPATVSMGPNGVRAAWVIQENQRRGTAAWKIAGTPPGTIAGFANRTYAAAGDTITLYVSTNAPDLHLETYRMGYYDGQGRTAGVALGGCAGHAAARLPTAHGREHGVLR